MLNNLFSKVLANLRLTDTSIKYNGILCVQAFTFLIITWIFKALIIVKLIVKNIYLYFFSSCSKFIELEQKPGIILFSFPIFVGGKVNGGLMRKLSGRLWDNLSTLMTYNIWIKKFQRLFITHLKQLKATADREVVVFVKEFQWNQSPTTTK